MKTLSINMEAQFHNDESSDELLDRIVTALKDGEIDASLEPVEVHDR